MQSEATDTPIAELKNIKLTPKFLERFWRNVNKNGPIPEHMPHLGNCWDWTGVIESTGYGSISSGRTGLTVHRISYVIHNGRFDKDLLVLHKCDRRSCMRGDHLFIGTRGDNIRDAAAKGRTAKGDKNGKRTHPESIPRGENHPLRKNPSLAARGERSGAAKLTEQQVIAIRSEADPIRRNFSILARQYNISKTNIRDIYIRRTWRHLP